VETSDQYDVIVVGAGSGGIGAALAAARGGLDVLLVERAERIGGTVVRAGVSIWEMGVGGTGFPFEIYQRLLARPGAVGIYSIGRHCLWPKQGEDRPYPGGESVLDPSRRYLDTLRRYGARTMAQDEALVRELWHGVVMDPVAYHDAVRAMLIETGRGTLQTSTSYRDVHASAGRINGLVMEDGERVSADAYIDCTGSAALARAAGAEATLGQESRSLYGEPDAPEHSSDRLNGATLIYHVARTQVACVEPPRADVPRECWWRPDFPVASVVHLPTGRIHVNMLPTMAGEEAQALPPERAYLECRRRVQAHWRHMQTVYPEFQRYALAWIAPTLGVRESWRIIGETVLTEHDLLAGLSGQKQQDIIALADHAMDTHGTSTGRAGCREMREPYGIPYRCMIPKNFTNLLVACRGAGFSSLAASSCRLSRTMMQLGQAAGTAAAIASDKRLSLPEVPIGELRARLRAQWVQLELPMPTDLAAHLTAGQ
jgi:glycine/D-amino acid oxidase-like deaminating enzyme